MGLQLKTGVMCENLEGWIFFPAGWKKTLKAWYMWDDLLEGVGANFGNQSQIFAFGKMLDFNLTGCLEDLYVGTFL